MMFKGVSRVKAALLHLLISAVIACLLSWVVFAVWYPAPLSEATDVLHIFLLVMGVDVIIGPLITLIIFNSEKKELKWDLVIIALLQISALVYGVITVHKSRPVYIVFNIDRFDLVRASDLSIEKLNDVKFDEFKKLPQFGPELVIAVRPVNADERQKLLFSALEGGDDLPFMPQYYEPYSNKMAQVSLRAINIDELAALNKDSISEIDTLKKKYEARGILIGYLPLKASHKDVSVIVNGKTGQFLEIINLKPWN